MNCPQCGKSMEKASRIDGALARINSRIYTTVHFWKCRACRIVIYEFHYFDEEERKVEREMEEYEKAIQKQIKENQNKEKSWEELSEKWKMKT
jgi:hypothetical protein